MHPHVDVEASVQLRLVVADADAVPLPVSLRYCATDPYAVRAVFSGDGMEVEWVFARDLLRTGLTSPVGEGDLGAVAVSWICPARRGPTRLTPSLTWPFFGADDGIRTRDPHLGKVMLYQLSHVRAAPTGGPPAQCVWNISRPAPTSSNRYRPRACRRRASRAGARGPRRGRGGGSPRRRGRRP